MLSLFLKNSFRVFLNRTSINWGSSMEPLCIPANQSNTSNLLHPEVPQFPLLLHPAGVVPQPPPVPQFLHAMLLDFNQQTYRISCLHF
jgi:hypothetical protein